MTDVYYTVGPASLELAGEMIEAGANGARLTFSYGTPELQLERAKHLKSTAAQCGLTFSIMADLPGGGMRLGGFSYAGNGFFYVETDEIVALMSDEVVEMAAKSLPIPKELLDSVKVGDRLVVGDGVVVFEVVQIKNALAAKAISAGRVENNRGVTLQDGDIEPVCLTDTDKASLEHIAEHEEYDAVALSFVASAADVQAARVILADAPKKIIAKIETPNGVKNIEEIAAVADLVMVARGDLALTMPWQQMPQAVETVVTACISTDTPYIIATQVAESMSEATMMSRAEMCDLWHWQKQGVAGVLLSRETGWGKHPPLAVAAVRTLLDTPI